MKKQEFIEKYGEDKYHETLGNIANAIEMTKGIFDIKDSLTAVHYLRESINRQQDQEYSVSEDQEYYKISEALDLYEEDLKNNK